MLAAFFESLSLALLEGVKMSIYQVWARARARARARAGLRVRARGPKLQPTPQPQPKPKPNPNPKPDQMQQSHDAMWVSSHQAPYHPEP